ncbi:MBL fold metallo-hydrolase [Cryomorphaceae bacterium 1068]|nr:MBL fold metallo-hydrolase [Cryomorphaceae bacterium 1068]
MKIEFVSHAGFIVEAGSKKIFIDPWTKSKTFNDSWALLTGDIEVDYSGVDYIFVTHEHPDHFNFPTLKGIDIHDKKRIKILYQKHASTRLKDAFEKLGFSQVIELPIYKWTSVDKFELYCGSAGSMDSFLAIKSDNKSIVNLNDCVFRKKQYEYISRQIGKVDFLFTQFSFANWVGNQEDEIGASKKKIEDLFLQKEIFSPQYIIPFASFVYFCNEENSRMNDWINSPEDIAKIQIPEIQFMYPHDKIDTNNTFFNSKLAVEKYMRDFKKMIIDPTPAQIPFQEITLAIEANLKIFKKKIKYPFRRMVKPFGIYIHDIDRSIFIDPKNGKWTETSKENTRYSMCSQVCWYTFKYEWGTGTLQVSGMFLDRKYPEPTSKYFFFQNMLSTGFLSTKSIRQTFRTLNFIWRKKWEIFYRFV